ncbi:MAG: kinase [Solirubrobacteraceae bacterium]|nr:kinase [Solirubrobacteraceae bacterium]
MDVNARPHAPETAAAPALELKRIGLVVHPRREIDTALDNARAWAFANGAEIVQIKVSGQERVVADPGEIASCDLVLAVGGDGTALHALHAAAKVNRLVLGVACGSLGALTATAAEDLPEALDGIAAGRWSPRRLPGLRVTSPDGLSRMAINDVVVVRRGPSQVIVGIFVDDQLYVRYAGDGIVVATPAGSSAYTLAAGGPVLAERSEGIVLTPLAAHGGCCPPLVVGSTSSVRLAIEPGYGGARMEFDGQAEDAEPAEFAAAREEDYATLVGLGDSEPLLAGLRRRRILIDSPRVLARDDREALRGS